MCLRIETSVIRHSDFPPGGSRVWLNHTAQDTVDAVSVDGHDVALGRADREGDVDRINPGRGTWLSASPARGRRSTEDGRRRSLGI